MRRFACTRARRRRHGAEWPISENLPILIPLPGTGGDEQRVNANVLGNAGDAIVIDQAEATPERIEAELNRLSCNDAVLATMAANAKSVGKPNAAAELADLILSTAKPVTS